MKECYSSGIQYLDDLMGGIQLGDNVVWVLEPGTYFDYFLEFFLTTSDNDHLHNIYISFDFPPQKVYSRYKDYFDRGDFILIDAFTFGKGKGDEFFRSFYETEPIRSGRVRVHCVEHASESEQFIKTLQKFQEEFKEGTLCKYVFDSLTGMQELWGERETLHFFTYTCPKLFELKALAYWPLARDAHSKAFLANISHITQLVISLDVQKDSTCTLGFLKLDGRPSHLLNKIHYYTFQDNMISFLGSQEEARDSNFEDDELYESRKDREKIPKFLLQKDKIKIGRRIRDFRLSRNVSQVELARSLGITPSALSQIEHEQSLPSLQLFVEIARFFRKPLDSFFTDFPASSKSPRSNKDERG